MTISYQPILFSFILFLLSGGITFSEESEFSLDRPFHYAVCPSSDGNPRNSEADVIELRDGTLLLAWSKFSGSADHAQAVIAAKKSRDGGITWGEEFVLQENTGRQNVMSVSLWRIRSGKILFFFLQKNANDDLQLYVRESLDDARTWSEPLRVTQGPGYHIMNNARLLELQDGRLLAPIAYCPDIGKDYDKQVCFCYISDDEGKTWKKASGEVRHPDTACMEPGLIEREDKSILMIIRTKLDRIFQSVSTDRGETWSEPEPMELVSPASPATITNMPGSGDLMIVWNNNPLGDQAGWQNRTPLTAAISRDGGKHWENLRNIADDPDSGYAYTSITFSGKRALLTYYHWKKGKPNFEGTDLIFHSIPIPWFYGK